MRSLITVYGRFQFMCIEFLFYTSKFFFLEFFAIFFAFLVVV